jgi:hypothetical protein
VSHEDSALDQRWVRADDVLWRRALDTTVLLPAGSASPVVLAGTGPRLWEEIADGGSVPELATRLSASFGVERDVVMRDIAPVVARLYESGAIKAAP